MKAIHQKIRGQGGRLTKARRAIIDVLSEGHCLVSKQELAGKLKAKKVEPDRSTIYRELRFLTKHNVIVKNTIAGVDHYEIPRDHHHHLVCLDCHSITKVGLGNHLEKQEKRIAKQYDFNIVSHTLEFYGYCRACRQA